MNLVKQPNYITPAPWAFAIWGLIHFLLGGFVIYQFFSSANDAVGYGVGYQFIFAQLLNSFWLSLWSRGHYFLSWIVVLFISSSISYIYYRLRNHYQAESFGQKLFIEAPFSLYHAWIVVVAFINTFAAFGGYSTPESPTFFQAFWAMLALFSVTSSAVGYVEYRGDSIGALVIAWYLFAVSANQPSPAIHYVSLVFGLIVSFYSFRPFFRFRSAEETPLVGA